MELTNYERETIIWFNEAEKTARIETFNGRLKRQLYEIHKARPDEAAYIGTDEYGAVTYELPKIWVSIRKPREISEAERERMRERMKTLRTGSSNEVIVEG